MQFFDSYEAFKYVYGISGFHRIQGSDGLVKAAEYVYENLKVKDKEVLLFKYDGETKYGSLVAPMGWEPLGGDLAVDGQRVTGFKEVPLFVVPHSPPGEAEGVVTEKIDDANGKIFMSASFSARADYLNAVKAGAKAVIFYSDSLPETATPYRSLFLKKDEMDYSAPAVAVPRRLARELREKTVKINVEAERGPKDLPVVYAKNGSNFLVSAHVCHPYPGANDNASGAGLSLALANSGANADFLWIPEHYGSMAFFSKYRPHYDFGINLDMVGENQKLTGSKLQISYTPLSQKSSYEELFKRAVKELGRSRDIAYEFTPFDTGSDHAVLVQNGIPAIDLTNWPDRYYHSSEDFVDKVSTETLEFVGKVVLKFLETPITDEVSEGWRLKYRGFLVERVGKRFAEDLISLDARPYKNSLPNFRNRPRQNGGASPHTMHVGGAVLEYVNLRERVGEEGALRAVNSVYGLREDELKELAGFME
ncbi:MAG: DUF4910 domain-containing protein [Thermoprotei archaeon]